MARLGHVRRVPEEPGNQIRLWVKFATGIPISVKWHISLTPQMTGDISALEGMLHASSIRYSLHKKTYFGQKNIFLDTFPWYAILYILSEK